VKHLHALLLLLLGIALAEGGLQAQQQAQPPSAPSPASAPQSETPPTPKPLVDQSQTPTIRATTGLVRLVATVTDRRHNFITDLAQNEFRVIEDGAPQNIQFFLREANLPLRIGLLLDTSNSIRPRLEFEQDAAIDFLNSVIRRNNKDQAFLMTFDNEPEVIQDYTGDLGSLMSAIRKQRAGGGTALNDAIYMASEKLLNPPPPRGPDLEIRRVLVVISDGDDNLSDHALSESIDAAIRAEVSIYAISTNTDWLALDTDNAKPQKYHLDEGDKVLQSFASETGGRVFFPYKVEDLGQSFVDIGAELRSQYFIAYAPTNPLSNGKYRKIEAETTRKGLIVRTRRGYYAVAPSEAVPPPGK
jgi:Ca-activated chloride channel homolog